MFALPLIRRSQPRCVGSLTENLYLHAFVLRSPRPVLQRGLLLVSTGTNMFLTDLLARNPASPQRMARHGTYLLTLKLYLPFLAVRTLALTRTLVPLVVSTEFLGLTRIGRKHMRVIPKRPMALLRLLLTGHLRNFVEVATFFVNNVVVVSFVAKIPPKSPTPISLPQKNGKTTAHKRGVRRLSF